MEVSTISPSLYLDGIHIWSSNENTFQDLPERLEEHDQYEILSMPEQEVQEEVVLVPHSWTNTNIQEFKKKHTVNAEVECGI